MIYSVAKSYIKFLTSLDWYMRHPVTQTYILLRIDASLLTVVNIRAIIAAFAFCPLA